MNDYAIQAQKLFWSRWRCWLSGGHSYFPHPWTVSMRCTKCLKMKEIIHNYFEFSREQRDRDAEHWSKSGMLKKN